MIRYPIPAWITYNSKGTYYAVVDGLKYGDLDDEELSIVMSAYYISMTGPIEKFPEYWTLERVANTVLGWAGIIPSRLPYGFDETVKINELTIVSGIGSTELYYYWSGLYRWHTPRGSGRKGFDYPNIYEGQEPWYGEHKVTLVERKIK